MGVDAENSSHMKKSILHLIEMFKQPKYMNKNDFFFGGGGARTYQTAIHTCIKVIPYLEQCWP